MAGRGSPVAPRVWGARRRCRARAIASRVPVAAPSPAATGRWASTTSGMTSTRTATRSAAAPCPCGTPRTWNTRPASASPPCRATARPGVWIPTTRQTWSKGSMCVITTTRPMRPGSGTSRRRCSSPPKMKSPWVTSSTTSSSVASGASCSGRWRGTMTSTPRRTSTWWAVPSPASPTRSSARPTRRPWSRMICRLRPPSSTSAWASPASRKGTPTTRSTRPSSSPTNRPRPFRAGPASSSWCPPPPQTPSPTRAVWGSRWWRAAATRTRTASPTRRTSTRWPWRCRPGRPGRRAPTWKWPWPTICQPPAYRAGCASSAAARP